MVAKSRGRRAKTAREEDPVTRKRGEAGKAVCARLRVLRVQKNFSQGDVEGKTGLLRCYISRVENGHTIPSVETLEKFAGALGVPLYQLFYEGDKPPAALHLEIPASLEALAAAEGKTGLDARFLLKIKKLVGKIPAADRDVLLTLAQKLAYR
ncbi:MAG: helix-turn-helix transcriptional regulator [Acidobacteriia bacterium]|nr:helix-turn-helix transcriptional regulator [Terriglobia bacterium]